MNKNLIYQSILTILISTCLLLLPLLKTSKALAYDCDEEYAEYQCPRFIDICPNQAGLQCGTCKISDNPGGCSGYTRVFIDVYGLTDRHETYLFTVGEAINERAKLCVPCYRDFRMTLDLENFRGWGFNFNPDEWTPKTVDIFIPGGIIDNHKSIQTKVYLCQGQAADCQNITFSPSDYNWNDSYTLSVTTTDDALVDKVVFYYAPVDPNNCPSNANFCSLDPLCWQKIGEDTDKTDGWSYTIDNPNLPNYDLQFAVDLFKYNGIWSSQYDLICSSNPGDDSDPANSCGNKQCGDCLVQISPPSITITPSPSPSPTPTVTPTISATPSPTPTVTPTISATPTEIPPNDNIVCVDLNPDPEDLTEINLDQEITLTCVIGGYEPGRVDFRYRVNGGDWLPPNDQWLTTTIINEANGGWTGSITDSAVNLFPEVNLNACTDVAVQCRGCVYDESQGADVCTAWPGQTAVTNTPTQEATPSATPDEHQACIKDPIGTWQDDFGNGCADLCSTNQNSTCLDVITASCNCGVGYCWDHDSLNCVEGSSAYTDDGEPITATPALGEPITATPALGEPTTSPTLPATVK